MSLWWEDDDDPYAVEDELSCLYRYVEQGIKQQLEALGLTPVAVDETDDEWNRVFVFGSEAQAERFSDLLKDGPWLSKVSKESDNKTRDGFGVSAARRHLLAILRQLERLNGVAVEESVA